MISINISQLCMNSLTKKQRRLHKRTPRRLTSNSKIKQSAIIQIIIRISTNSSIKLLLIRQNRIRSSLQLCPSILRLIIRPYKLMLIKTFLLVIFLMDIHTGFFFFFVVLTTTCFDFFFNWLFNFFFNMFFVVAFLVGLVVWINCRVS